MLKLTKQQLIEKIAEESGLPKGVAEKALNALDRVLYDSLLQGDAIPLGRLGTVKPESRGARTGRNPKTGEAIKIPARVVPVFHFSSTIKNALKRG